MKDTKLPLIFSVASTIKLQKKETTQGKTCVVSAGGLALQRQKTKSLCNPEFHFLSCV